MTALRECPFCGGEAEMLVGYHAKYDVKIGCVDCRSEGPLFGTNDFKGDDAKRHKDRAIAAWNRRTDDRYTLTPLGAAMLEGKK